MLAIVFVFSLVKWEVCIGGWFLEYFPAIKCYLAFGLHLFSSSLKSHGQRSLEGCSLCGRWDMTEWLHFHFSLSCIGEGNGNPLQCSCLESPRDRGAGWAAVYGVAQSRTRLKWLSSSSSSTVLLWYNLKLFFYFTKGKSEAQGKHNAFF